MIWHVGGDVIRGRTPLQDTVARAFGRSTTPPELSYLQHFYGVRARQTKKLADDFERQLAELGKLDAARAAKYTGLPRPADIVEQAPAAGSELDQKLGELDQKLARLQPALFSDTTNDMRINREEVFGPVVSVIRAKGYDEALAVANDTQFGLTSGICTSSLKHASHFRRNSEAGMVMVNLPTAGVDYHVPFGGRKGSSYGPREQGRHAAEFYTSVKTAYIKPV